MAKRAPARSAFSSLSFPPLLLLALALARPAAGTADSLQEGIDAPGVRRSIVEKAVAWLNTPYLYGGLGSEGMDCSGLVYRVFLDITGRSLPRGVAELFLEGTEAREPYLPGDLLFFDTTGGPSHVGIWLGTEDRFVHSASQGPVTGVIISSLAERYYRARLIGARRLIHRQALELRLALGSPPQVRQLSLPLAADLPVRIVMSGRELPDRRFYLRIYSSEGEVVARLLSLDEKSETSYLWVVPRSGDWLLQAQGVQGADLGSLILLPEEQPQGKDQ